MVPLCPSPGQRTSDSPLLASPMSVVHIFDEGPRPGPLPEEHPSPQDNLEWRSRKCHDDDLVQQTILGNCFIFLASEFFLTSEHHRRQLSLHFQLPHWLWNKSYQRSNGSFGCDVVYGHDGVVQGRQVWSRFLVKQLEQNTPFSDQTYTWYEMTFFAIWSDPGHTIVLCFDTPDGFRQPLYEAVNKSLVAFRTPDIYYLHSYIIEQLLILYDKSVWTIRNFVREAELDRSRPYYREPHFPKLHDLARHAIHVSETLDVAVENMSCMMYQHESMSKARSASYGQENPMSVRTLQRFNFQLQTFKSLKMRSDSNQARLRNEITLAFNLVTQRDSQAAIRISRAVRSDSTAMKTVAVLTLVFLPATFVSAIFSTSFFSFSPASQSATASWTVSDHFWIYWAFAAPLTAATVGSWFAWQRWLGPE